MKFTLCNKCFSCFYFDHGTNAKNYHLNILMLAFRLHRTVCVTWLLVSKCFHLAYAVCQFPWPEYLAVFDVIYSNLVHVKTALATTAPKPSTLLNSLNIFNISKLMRETTSTPSHSQKWCLETCGGIRAESWLKPWDLGVRRGLGRGVRRGVRRGREGGLGADSPALEL